MSNCTIVDIHGYHRIEWMLKAFGECVHTPMEQASFYIGLSSIGFWLFANFPQIYENYRNSNASSLHLAFLIQWILGDSLNLIGAILTGQLATQIATAIYYITMDVILVTQWIYYQTRDYAKKVRQAQSDKTYLQSALYLVFVLVVIAMVTMSVFPVFQPQNDLRVNQVHMGRKLLSQVQYTQLEDYVFGDDDNNPGPDDGWPPKGAKEIIGYIIGVFSAALYLGSRVPQILKNFARRSTEGLSLMLFLCAFMGNVTYSLSIFLFSRKREFLLGKLPWIIGSAGVLTMDFCILMQFLFFKVILKTEGKYTQISEEETSLIYDHEVPQDVHSEPFDETK